jgi:hypothetical protein
VTVRAAHVAYTIAGEIRDVSRKNRDVSRDRTLRVVYGASHRTDGQLGEIGPPALCSSIIITSVHYNCSVNADFIIMATDARIPHYPCYV